MSLCYLSQISLHTSLLWSTPYLYTPQHPSSVCTPHALFQSVRTIPHLSLPVRTAQMQSLVAPEIWIGPFQCDLLWCSAGPPRTSDSCVRASSGTLPYSTNLLLHHLLLLLLLLLSSYFTTCCFCSCSIGTTITTTTCSWTPPAAAPQHHLLLFQHHHPLLFHSRPSLEALERSKSTTSSCGVLLINCIESMM